MIEVLSQEVFTCDVSIGNGNGRMCTAATSKKNQNNGNNGNNLFDFLILPLFLCSGGFMCILILVLMSPPPTFTS